MRKRVTARFANGVASACIVVVFLVHAALGTASVLTGLTSPFGWLVWVGVGLIVAHVGLCAVTSVQQLTDAQRPPSARKKRHLALKWATGVALALVAGLHVMGVPLQGLGAISPRIASIGLLTILLAALAFHVCVGAKSLLKDIDVDRRYKMAFRVVVCVVAAACCCGIWVSLA